MGELGQLRLGRSRRRRSVLRCPTRRPAWTLASFVLLTVGLAACGGEDAPVSEASERAVPAPAAVDGLAESDVQIAGLALPTGLEPAFVDGRAHHFRSESRLDVLRTYFAARLEGGSEVPLGTGFVLRDATVRRSGERVDLSIVPSSRGGVRVRVSTLPARSEPASDDVDAGSNLQLDEYLQRLD